MRSVLHRLGRVGDSYRRHRTGETLAGEEWYRLVTVLGRPIACRSLDP